MVKAQDLVDLFRQALCDGWGYIYGTAGTMWTQAKQDAATDDMARKHGQRWVGKMVADCSGLFVWSFKQLGGEMYHGSNTMWRSWLTERHDSIGSDIVPGAAVFKVRDGSDYHHVGLYVGDGMVIEAKGTAYGVVMSKVSEWNCWGKMKGVEYAEKEPEKVLYEARVNTTATDGGTLNVRKSPSTNASVIGKLSNGAKVDVLEVNEAWSRIRSSIGEGWAMSKFLTMITDDDKVIIEDADGNQYAVRLPITIREGTA